MIYQEFNSQRHLQPDVVEANGVATRGAAKEVGQRELLQSTSCLSKCLCCLLRPDDKLFEALAGTDVFRRCHSWEQQLLLLSCCMELTGASQSAKSLPSRCHSGMGWVEMMATVGDGRGEMWRG